MVWRIDGPQGFEAQKIAFEALPFLHGRVVDLGCGVKRVFPGKHIIGIDPRADAPMGIIPLECQTLDVFSDGGLDTIFSSHLLEHIVDYKAALKDWWRTIKVGGYLCLYLPHKELYPNIGQPGANPDHKHDFMPEDITEAMKEVAWRSGHGWKQLRNETRAEGIEYSFWQVYQKQASVYCNVFEEKSRPPKKLGIVRLGAIGDTLWMTGVLSHFREQGYHITAYVHPVGEPVIRHDPRVDEIIVQPDAIFAGGDEFQLQMSYWQWEEKKYDRFINLCGSVERRLLYHLNDQNFFASTDQRQRMGAMNYMESVCEFAGVPFDAETFKIKFYPTKDEVEWARKEIGGRRFVVINPKGSGVKYWPYTQRAMELLSGEGFGGAVVGETGHAPLDPPPGWKVYGKEHSIRKIFAMAQLAEVVIGPESAITNSVSHEPNLKIVFLGHSTPENLTRDWKNTVPCIPSELACYPCHRVHIVPDYCHFDKVQKVAQCCSQYLPELVVERILEELTRREAA